MMSRPHSYESTLRGLQEVREANDDLRPLLDYFEGVLEARAAVRAAFDADLSHLDLSACGERMIAGEPLLSADDVRLNDSLFGDLFEQIAAMGREQAPAEQKSAWADMPGDAGEWSRELVRGLLVENGLLPGVAEKIGADEAVLTYVASQAIAPFLESYADKLAEYVDDSKWMKGSCPVCGGEPLMARLEKETGKRLLQCYLCGTEWEYKRLECPLCGNEDQKKLRFFADEEDKTYRVEVCDVCKGYIKTIDTREIERDTCLLVENLATLHLDLVARKEGFQRETNKLFGL
jgi:FdhE protein